MNGITAKARTLAPDQKSNLFVYDALATGLIPETLIRLGVKLMLAQKLRELHLPDPDARWQKQRRFKEELERMPIAIATNQANNQHYEVPTAFFAKILGPRMKYSCCLWDKASDLVSAEEDMLDLYCQRAEIVDGQRILDLGCGWGSFTLFAAARFPSAKITSVSNSRTQRQYIEAKAKELGLNNIHVITSDINELSLERNFDRIVSIEMLEHAKNYKQLFKNIAGWLVDDGKMFVHIFSHKEHAYHFGESDDDWLARYFFTGGTMPSDTLFYAFADDLVISRHWRVNGQHYQKTAEAWLARMQDNRAGIKEILADCYGIEQTTRWWVYWRMFFIACAELWGYSKGEEWIVSHYLFEKR